MVGDPSESVVDAFSAGRSRARNDCARETSRVDGDGLLGAARRLLEAALERSHRRGRSERVAGSRRESGLLVAETSRSSCSQRFADVVASVPAIERVTAVGGKPAVLVKETQKIQGREHFRSWRARHDESSMFVCVLVCVLSKTLLMCAWS